MALESNAVAEAEEAAVSAMLITVLAAPIDSSTDPFVDLEPTE